jgi:hypothetical protein
VVGVGRLGGVESLAGVVALDGGDAFLDGLNSWIAYRITKTQGAIVLNAACHAITPKLPRGFILPVGLNAPLDLRDRHRCRPAPATAEDVSRRRKLEVSTCAMSKSRST